MLDETKPSNTVANSKPGAALAVDSTSETNALAAHPVTDVTLSQMPEEEPGLDDRPAGDANSPVIPGFEIVGELGRGGMGVVYRARDLAFDREVAVKLLLDKYAAQSAAAHRFLDEAKITGQLQHPGIPAVHQVGVLAEGRPFLAMKLIKGQTLDELLAKRSSLDSPNMLAVFEAICQTVGYAHVHQVVHRDLKPNNIMVGSFGEVQVMDWGLAKVLTASPQGASAIEPTGADSLGTVIRSMRDSDTLAGSVLGTPAYMSPEQAGGEINRVDQRSDVFALGAILCVILTGEPPYVAKDGKTALLAAMRGKLDDARARLNASNAEPEMIDLAKRCLSFEPSDRPANGAEVAGVMAAYRAGVEERVRRTEAERAAATAQAREQKKRRRVQMALAGAVVCILAIGGFAAWKNEQNRAERVTRFADTRQTVLIALSKARQFTERADEAPAESIADADANLALRQQAVTTAEQANSALTAGLGDDDLRNEVAATLTAYREAAARAEILREMLQKEDRFIADLDKARLAMATWIDGKFDYQAQLAGFARAFASLDIDVEKLEVSEAARRLTQLSAGRARSEAIFALHEWAVGELTPQELKLRICSLLDAVDDDDFRKSIRTAFVAKDYARLVQMSEMAKRQILPQTVYVLFGRLMRPKEKRSILQHGQVLYPGNFWLNLALAESFLNEKLWAAGVRYSQAALALRPKTPAVLQNIGSGLIEMKDFDGAIAAYSEAIRIAPEFSMPYEGLGRVLQETKNFDGAIAAYRSAIRLDPKNDRPHCGLGVSLLSKKDFDGAIAAYREAIRLDPKSVRAHIGRGAALHGKKDFEGAITAYSEAIRLDPKSALAYVGFGGVLRDKNNLSGAISVLKKAIALDPKLVIARFELGVLLQEKNDLEGAIATYQDAIRIDPNHILAHYKIGSLFQSKNDLNEAITYFKKAIELDPKLAYAHSDLGLALQNKGGELNAAISCYKRAIELDPQLFPAHSNLGNALYDKKETEGAIACYKKAIEINPHYAFPHNGLGNIMRDRENFDGAIACYKRAVEIDAKFWAAHANLGVVYQLQGNFGHSVESLREAGRLQPANVQIKNLIRQSEQFQSVAERIPAIEMGKDQPKSPIEAITIAGICARPYQKRYQLAYDLSAKAFEQTPTLATAYNRYKAAGYAVRAASGDGINPPSESDRLLARNQALQWLQANLVELRKQLATDPVRARQVVLQQMTNLQNDANLDSVRAPEMLAKVPLEEREAWQRLWVDVRRLRDETAPRELLPLPKEVK